MLSYIVTFIVGAWFGVLVLIGMLALFGLRRRNG